MAAIVRPTDGVPSLREAGDRGRRAPTGPRRARARASSLDARGCRMAASASAVAMRTPTRPALEPEAISGDGDFRQARQRGDHFAAARRLRGEIAQGVHRGALRRADRPERRRSGAGVDRLLGERRHVGRRAPPTTTTRPLPARPARRARGPRPAAAPAAASVPPARAAHAHRARECAEHRDRGDRHIVVRVVDQLGGRPARPVPD